MKNIFKKCSKCNALVRVLNDCTCKECGLKCCDQVMEELKINQEEFSFEKHIPNYKIKDNKIVVSVNHVMEDSHYIKFIAIEKDNIYNEIKLLPGDNLEVEFAYIKGAKIYSYCNKHGLWMVEVE